MPDEHLPAVPQQNILEFFGVLGLGPRAYGSGLRVYSLKIGFKFRCQRRHPPRPRPSLSPSRAQARRRPVPAPTPAAPAAPARRRTKSLRSKLRRWSLPGRDRGPDDMSALSKPRTARTAAGKKSHTVGPRFWGLGLWGFSWGWGLGFGVDH